MHKTLKIINNVKAVNKRPLRKLGVVVDGVVVDVMAMVVVVVVARRNVRC